MWLSSSPDHRSSSEAFQLSRIYTRSTYLRPPNDDDLQDLYAIELGSASNQWRFRGAPPTFEEYVSDLTRYSWLWIVSDRATGRATSMVGVRDVDPIAAHGHLVFVVGDERISSLRSLEGVAAALLAVFQEGLRKVYAELPASNMARFETGSGKYFEVEGLLKYHALVNDEFEDVYVLAFYPARLSESLRGNALGRSVGL